MSDNGKLLTSIFRGTVSAGAYVVPRVVRVFSSTLRFALQRKFTVATAAAGIYGSYELADHLHYLHDQGMSLQEYEQMVADLLLGDNGEITPFEEISNHITSWTHHGRLILMGSAGGTASAAILKNVFLWAQNGHTAGQFHNGVLQHMSGSPMLSPVIAIGSGIIGGISMDKMIEAANMLPDNPAMQTVFIGAGIISAGMMIPRALAGSYMKLKYDR